jgi:hypothetical protein
MNSNRQDAIFATTIARAASHKVRATRFIPTTLPAGCSDLRFDKCDGCYEIPHSRHREASVVAEQPHEVASIPVIFTRCFGGILDPDWVPAP